MSCLDLSVCRDEIETPSYSQLQSIFKSLMNGAFRAVESHCHLLDACKENNVRM